MAQGRQVVPRLPGQVSDQGPEQVPGQGLAQGPGRPSGLLPAPLLVCH